MKREIRDRWTAALRSGDYTQGHGKLKSGDAYCCLGVLCAVAPELTEPIVLDEAEQNDNLMLTDFNNGDDNDIIDRIGLPLWAHSALWRMNDGEDFAPSKSFAQIADWIEENVPLTNGEPST